MPLVSSAVPVTFAKSPVNPLPTKHAPCGFQKKAPAPLSECSHSGFFSPGTRATSSHSFVSPHRPARPNQAAAALNQSPTQSRLCGAGSGVTTYAIPGLSPPPFVVSPALVPCTHTGISPASQGQVVSNSPGGCFRPIGPGSAAASRSPLRRTTQTTASSLGSTSLRPSHLHRPLPGLVKIPSPPGGGVCLESSATSWSSSSAASNATSQRPKLVRPVRSEISESSMSRMLGSPHQRQYAHGTTSPAASHADTKVVPNDSALPPAMCAARSRATYRVEKNNSSSIISTSSSSCSSKSGDDGSADPFTPNGHTLERKDSDEEFLQMYQLVTRQNSNWAYRSTAAVDSVGESPSAVAALRQSERHQQLNRRQLLSQVFGSLPPEEASDLDVPPPPHRSDTCPTPSHAWVLPAADPTARYIGHASHEVDGKATAAVGAGLGAPAGVEELDAGEVDPPEAKPRMIMSTRGLPSQSCKPQLQAQAQETQIYPPANITGPGPLPAAVLSRRTQQQQQQLLRPNEAVPPPRRHRRHHVSFSGVVELIGSAVGRSANLQCEPTASTATAGAPILRVEQGPAPPTSNIKSAAHSKSRSTRQNAEPVGTFPWQGRLSKSSGSLPISNASSGPVYPYSLSAPQVLRNPHASQPYLYEHVHEHAHAALSISPSMDVQVDRQGMAPMGPGAGRSASSSSNRLSSAAARALSDILDEMEF